jgi:hypothetical protein
VAEMGYSAMPWGLLLYDLCRVQVLPVSASIP